jgi:hypothetical protein
MLSFGDVQPHADKIKRAGALMICQVQTVEQAKDAVANGADVLVAQGAEAAATASRAAPSRWCRGGRCGARRSGRGRAAASRTGGASRRR